MSAAYEFFVQWSPSTGDWRLYQFIDSDGPLPLVKEGQWAPDESGHQLIPIGNYVIDRVVDSNQFRLWQIDISQSDFLPSVVAQGDLSTVLDPTADIIPLGNYLLLYWPSTGSYKCRRFDPSSSTLMPPDLNTQNIVGHWNTIANSELVPVAGYVVARDKSTGACRTWMFDGGNSKVNSGDALDVLPDPQIPGMQWTIDKSQNLCALGDRIVAWSPGSSDITFWTVDPTQASPLLPPKTITAWNSALPADAVLFGIAPRVPLTLPNGVQGGADGPGTMAWMRQRIKKVVYLMLENRSFDHILGDLYSQGGVGNFIGSNVPFDGASGANWNADESGQNFYYQTKYSGQSLNYPTGSPDHSYPGVNQQLFEDIGGSWDNFYPTMFPFVDGDQTYCFGQDKSKRWFISAVSSDGVSNKELASGILSEFFGTMFPFVADGQLYWFGQSADNNNWSVYTLSAQGIGKAATASGSLPHFYPTMFPFVDNGQLYCFGQDADDNNWFVSTLSAQGVGSDARASGHWNHFYPTMFPFVDKGQLYCFGQNSDNKHWFISTLSAQGVGSDELASGNWDHFYPTMFSFVDDGQQYCFGQNSDNNHWFISTLSVQGVGSEELASGNWDNFYPTMFPIAENGKTYCFGQNEGNSWFISAISVAGIGTTPIMKGFVRSYGSQGQGPNDIMNYYDASLMEPLSTLARQFAVSDRWFCSMPGPTDTNRAFALTGSSFGTVENFESGQIYTSWPGMPRRPSVWDALWAHGIKDWKLYYHATWGGLRYTSQLFLQGHINEVDQAPNVYQGDIRDFMSAAQSGTLPAFSFIEPAWLGNSSGVVPNSCHPPSDMEPGLKLIADIYNALRRGPDFDDTLLVITFDEHGGIYDHVPPPFANNAYRNDTDEGFGFDMLGVRVPTVLISPWIGSATVFRSTQAGREYDATSFIATLLQWQGVPASNWWLGDRIRAAATFESVFQRQDAREDTPASVQAPALDPKQLDMPMHDLHRLFINRIVHTLFAGVLPSEDAEREAQDICALGSIRLAAQALDSLEARVRRVRESS